MVEREHLVVAEGFGFGAATTNVVIAEVSTCTANGSAGAANLKPRSVDLVSNARPGLLFEHGPAITGARDRVCQGATMKELRGTVQS
jgi:hypothetical protein